MPTTRVLAPGDYLDAYRAAPRADGIPDALHTLLTDAETHREGRQRYASLDVPTDLLPALLAVTDGHFRTWGEEWRSGSPPPRSASACAPPPAPRSWSTARPGTRTPACAPWSAPWPTEPARALRVEESRPHTRPKGTPMRLFTAVCRTLMCYACGSPVDDRGCTNSSCTGRRT